MKKINHIVISGNIGVGKTTLVKNFINIKQKKNNLPLTEVTSPTFNLLNEYDISDLVIRHYDLYRLKFKSEINNLDLYNIGNDTITFIDNKDAEVIDVPFSLINKARLLFDYSRLN